MFNRNQRVRILVFLGGKAELHTLQFFCNDNLTTYHHKDHTTQKKFPLQILVGFQQIHRSSDLQPNFNSERVFFDLLTIIRITSHNKCPVHILVGFQHICHF